MRPVIDACAVLAAIGFAVQLIVVNGHGAWLNLVWLWIYLVPLWAVLTVVLSTNGVVVGGGRTHRRVAFRLRVVAGGLVVGLLVALHAGAHGWWLPLVAAIVVAAGLADLAEIGPDRDELARLITTGLRRAIAIVLVFHYVCLAWVFFRATSFANALAVLRQIALGETDHANLVPLVTCALAVGFLCHFFATGSFRWLRERFASMHPVAQGAVLACVVLVLRELGHAKLVKFIYFQF
jgi:hypothetical protein